jgi:CubicO group peptidase (beta-lactamase class C family)
MAVVAAGCGKAAPAPTVAGPGAAMDAYLSNLAAGHTFKGAVLVARGTEVLFSKGYGMADQKAGVPNTPDTLYRIGSVTKQFTALAVLKLQERGKLKVTDRVCRHITPCPPAWEKITVEHLLVHTSGIQDYLGFVDRPSFWMTALSPEHLVGLFRNRPTQFPPGFRWQYSNSGYALLGYLIERITGVSYADFLRKQILDPLGLTATGYDVNRPTSKAHAVGYIGGSSPATFIDTSVAYAAGDVLQRQRPLPVEPLPADAHPRHGGAGHPDGHAHTPGVARSGRVPLGLVRLRLADPQPRRRRHLLP